MPISEEPRLAATQHPVTPHASNPSLAVVVASNGARAPLSACLAALVPRCLRDGAELIVARADRPGAILELSGTFPTARFIAAPPGTPLPALRSAGLAATHGDVVTLFDDVDDRALDGGPSLRAPGGSCSRHARQSGTTTRPYLSVIVPVHQGARVLARSLEAVARSDLPRTSWELIVVDDASTDETAPIAAQYADILVRLPGRPHGPAYARNRGFEVASGECIAFVDADVCVRQDTLGHFARICECDPEVGAVFGSVDVSSAASGFVSQYRNLLTHYYHRENPGTAETFWASCGAIRGDVFADAGMFDEWHFPRRQIEDSELGYRLRQRGHTIVLRPEIQATHLKHWTLRSMISADLHDRTVPWMRMADKPRATAPRSSGRLRRVKRVNTAITWLALGLALGALLGGVRWPLLVAGLCLGAVLLNNIRQYRFLSRRRSVGFAMSVIPLDLLSYAVNGVALTYGWLLRELVGPPVPAPMVEAFSECGVEMWPPVPARRPAAPAESPEAS